MECNLTVNFLKTARLALIACEDEKLLHAFSGFLLSQSQSLYEISYATPQEVSQKLTALIGEEDGNAFLSIQCDSYHKLRSIYFYIPENLKSDIQIFVLRYHESGVKLECELGTRQGKYILFDYDGAAQFKERE